jgi:MFS family permease
MTAPATAASLWRHRSFGLLWAGDTISQVGSQLTGLALPVLAVTVLHADAAAMGVLGAAETAAFLLVGLPAGALVDRWHKQRVLVLGDAVRAVALGSVPVAWLLGGLTLPHLVVVALITGLATVFFDVSYQSYLPVIVPSTQLVEGNAKLEASRAVAQVAGPAVGGVLLRVLAAPVLVAVDAASFVLSALFVGRIPSAEQPPPRSERRPLHVEIGEGLAFVLRSPLLRRIAACTSISNFAAAMTNAVIVLYLLRSLHLGTDQVGLVFALSAVGGLAGAIGADRLVRRTGEGAAIPLTATVFAVFAVCVPLAVLLPPGPARIAFLAAGGFVTSVAVVAYNVVQVSFRQRLCPPALLGRMNASVRFLVWGTMPLGALAGGGIGSAFGVLAALWWAIAIGGLGALPVVLGPFWRMRELPRPAEDPAT